MGRKTKGRNRTKDRRMMRRREKNAEVKRDIMLGGAARRGYGVGVPLVKPVSQSEPK